MLDTCTLAAFREMNSSAEISRRPLAGHDEPGQPGPDRRLPCGDRRWLPRVRRQRGEPQPLRPLSSLVWPPEDPDSGEDAELGGRDKIADRLSDEVPTSGGPGRRSAFGFLPVRRLMNIPRIVPDRIGVRDADAVRALPFRGRAADHLAAGVAGDAAFSTALAWPCTFPRLTNWTRARSTSWTGRFFPAGRGRRTRSSTPASTRPLE